DKIPRLYPGARDDSSSTNFRFSQYPWRLYLEFISQPVQKMSSANLTHSRLSETAGDVSLTETNLGISFLAKCRTERYIKLRGHRGIQHNSLRRLQLRNILCAILRS